ncbi:MAG: PIN domain-containing protein [Candidatus Binatia bacterium]
MVLVDTSIWIRFLAGREPYARQLDRLLASDRVLGHELVYGELLIGDRGRTRGALLAAYSEIHRARTVSHSDAIALVEARQLRGRGIGWIDVHLLATALVERCTLWSADLALATLAAELRIAYAGTSSR